MQEQEDLDPRLTRPAELIDLSQLTDVAAWIAAAMASGMIGNAAYDLVRRFLTRQGGRKTQTLQEEVMADLVRRFPTVPLEEIQSRVASLMESAGFTRSVSAQPTASTERYDWEFFLIHASVDKPIARDVYEQLSARFRTFFDAAVLKPGDTWPMALAAALRATRIYVVLLRSSLGDHWYANEEIVQAIHYVRKDPKRKIVPVYLDAIDVGCLPYGLAEVQGLFLQHYNAQHIAAALQAIADERGA